MDGGVRRDAAGVPRTFGRRSFLRGIGAAGATAAMLGRAGAAGASPAFSLPHAYRLSNRGMVVCTACKGHGAHRYFRRARFANHGRAHKGCNCRIVSQRISRKLWKRYFVNPNGTLRNFWDDRWPAV